MASPQLQLVLELLRSRESDRSVEPSIEEMREGLERSASIFPIFPEVAREATDAPGVACEWIAHPSETHDPVILYFHGGAYALGSVATHRHLMARLAHESHARVLGIDYRRAPEHPFPAAIDDAVAAYRWALDQGSLPSEIVLVGDSAGGGLALAALIALRDAGDPLPAAAAVMSPWVDLEGTAESIERNAAHDPMINRESLLRAAEAYLDGADPRHPLAAPLHAELHGLPPLLIQAGGKEALLDDAVRFADKARAAGVNVRLECWEDMMHVWQFFAPLLPEGRQALVQIGEFIRGATGGGLLAQAS